MGETCPYCGHRSSDVHPQFCSACGERIDNNRVPNGLVSEARHHGKKDPQVAVFCSSLIPGMGQVYNGEILKGFVFFFGSLCGAFLLLLPGLIVWVYSMYDAHIIAGKMNDGTLEFRQMQTVYMVLFVAVAVFIVIAVCVIVVMIVISGMISLLGPAGNSDFSQMLQFYGHFI